MPIIRQILQRNKNSQLNVSLGLDKSKLKNTPEELKRNLLRRNKQNEADSDSMVVVSNLPLIVKNLMKIKVMLRNIF